MAEDINNQYDFFKAVQLDADGNLLVSIVNGLSGDYLPLSGGTVTGDTVFTAGLTANSLSSNSILWEVRSQDNSGVIAPKTSVTTNPLNSNGVVMIGGTGGQLACSDTNDSILVGRNSGIHKSDVSSSIGTTSGQIYNSLNASIFASNNATIGEGSSGNLASFNNAIIGSSDASTIVPVGASTRKIRNSAIIASKNVDVNNILGEDTERILVLGMKDYTTNKQGVHVENLYVTSGATKDYVLTAEADGKAVWKAGGGGGNLNVDGGNAASIPVAVNLDGGGA